MKIKLLLTVAISLLAFASCKTINAVKMIYSTEAEYQDYKSDSKEIRYVPMVHLSTKDFYKDVERLVKEAKTDGYALFYEWVDFDEANETEQRKLRKLVGFIPSKEGYQKIVDQMDDERLMAQDNDQFLNVVNDKDYNVDIAPQEVLKQYEQRYGELVLTEEDLNTPLTEKKIHQSRTNKL